MKVVAHPKSEMKKKKEKNPGTSAARKKRSDKSVQSEFDKKIWSVITFDSCAASGLTYREAAEKLEKLKAENVSGLCIVTDEAAARITARRK
jgi:hypothetical protein